MTKTMDVVFVLMLLVLVYTFFLYPLIVWIWSRFSIEISRDSKFLPSITVLIPVYNEQLVIQEKLDNCLSLEYPKERIMFVFASDGSKDQTVEILRQCSDSRVQIFDYSENRGKAVVLNEAVQQLRSDLVILSDASGILDSQAILVLASYFNDENVGAVCGMYHIFKEGRTRVDAAESSYHGFEMLLRMWEGRIWSTLSGTGSLCAIRRSDYQALPEQVINDDYILPAKIALSGKRVVYSPDAHVYDRISTSLAAVYRRRVRIAFGNWQQIGHLKLLLNAFHRPYLSWVYYSHKLLRLALPFVLILLFISSFSQAQWIYATFSLAAVTLILLGWLGLMLDPYMRGKNPLGFILLIFFNNVAVIVGTFKFLARRQIQW